MDSGDRSADLARRRLENLRVGLRRAGRFSRLVERREARRRTDNSSLQNVFNVTSGIYTMDYAAASPGQVLTIKFTNADLHDALIRLCGAGSRDAGYHFSALASGNPPGSANVFRFDFLSETGRTYTVEFSSAVGPPMEHAHETSRATLIRLHHRFCVVRPTFLYASEVRD